ncbi:hypothetical protein ABIC28_002123 [Rhodococcus sp. PvR044]|uniref:esterase-like activity of phytase family protein n=1 Tax=Rhodococcus sp. PvR044 TaxID=3156402 RepID=UPI00339416FF
MRTHTTMLTAAAAAVLAAVAAAPASAAPPAAPIVKSSATLPATPLSDVQKQIADDRGVNLGGIGSGIFPIGGNEYWTVTDRGPNGEVKVDGSDRRTFVVPEFTPALVRIRVVGDRISVLETLPLTTPAGAPVTGLSNLPRDEKPYAADAATPLPLNPNGLDTEGVVRTPDGHFWLVDEYGPSIVEADAKGRVVARHVPAGLEDDYVAAGVAYPVTGSLPAGLADRKANRGFEDIALLPDGHTVAVALQSSLVVSGDKDRTVTELLTFDTATRATVHEFGYQFDDPSTFAAGTRGRDLKISALIPLSQTRVLVEERTDTEARFHAVDLDPGRALITSADKTLFANLAGVAGVPGKIEGAAMHGNRLILISDNDFGFDGTRAYAAGEKVADSGIETVLVEVNIDDGGGSSDLPFPVTPLS